ncbi:Endoplasmic reticulum vesicle transporter, C-terminal [Phytophthora cactorum]|nr:Endoplasmic reticulum vesicle transporter, C-terminal [Phytophthora cactorum]
MDVAGELQVNMHQTVVKTRLDVNGLPISMNTDEIAKTDLPAGYCGSCYGARHPAGKDCCNTCEEVKEAFIHSDLSLEEAEQKEQCVRESIETEKLAQDGEGCRFTGKMFVNRVAGNFHVALGRTFHRQGRLVHQFRPGQEHTYNSSHIIHSLPLASPYLVLQALSMASRRSRCNVTGGVFQYYIKIVPTIYSDIDENAIHSYQFSVTQQGNYLNPRGQMTSLPGTFFVFDLSPFMVKVENDRVPFTHFLTKICAIVGGVISDVRNAPSACGSCCVSPRPAAERAATRDRRRVGPAARASLCVAGLVARRGAVPGGQRLRPVREDGRALCGERLPPAAQRVSVLPVAERDPVPVRQFVARRLAIVADAAAAVALKRQELQRLKRREEAVWSPPKERSKRREIKPTVENHVLPAAVTDHAASILQHLKVQQTEATGQTRRVRRASSETLVQTDGLGRIGRRCSQDSHKLATAIADVGRQLGELSSALMGKITSVENRLGRLEDQIHDVQAAVEEQRKLAWESNAARRSEDELPRSQFDQITDAGCRGLRMAPTTFRL